MSWRMHKGSEELLIYGWKTIKSDSSNRVRQKNTMGRVLMGEVLLKVVIDTKFEGQRLRERKRKSMLKT